jgi:hypothetical protein
LIYQFSKSLSKTNRLTFCSLSQSQRIFLEQIATRVGETLCLRIQFIREFAWKLLWNLRVARARPQAREN